MKVLNYILTFILTLIITVLICLIFVANLLNSTILSKNYILSKFDETDYYNKIYEYVESNFEKYLNQSGLDEEVLKNLITVEVIKTDTAKILGNIYDNAQETVDIDTIEQNLRNNIDKYLIDNNLDAKSEDIDAFVQTIGTEYLNSISHNKYEQKIYDGYSKILEFANKVKKLSIIAIIISIILLAIVNLRKIYNIFVKLGVSIFASGLFLLFVKFYINAKIDVRNLLILNDAISYTLRNIASELLGKFTRNGVIFTIIGLVIIVIPIYINSLVNKDVEE